MWYGPSLFSLICSLLLKDLSFIFTHYGFIILNVRVDHGSIIWGGRFFYSQLILSNYYYAWDQIVFAHEQNVVPPAVAI